MLLAPSYFISNKMSGACLQLLSFQRILLLGADKERIDRNLLLIQRALVGIFAFTFMKPLYDIVLVSLPLFCEKSSRWLCKEKLC